MDESTEEMFRYFEPLYEVIHDMPRPPESFFKSRGGEWGRLCPEHPRPGAALLVLPLSPPGTGTASGSPLSPGTSRCRSRGDTGRTHPPDPAGALLLPRGSLGTPRVTRVSL